MEYNELDISQIKYNKTNLYYNGQRILINIPTMICKYGITQFFGKYQIKLEIIDEEFYNFIKKLEESNKKQCFNTSKYKSNIIYDDNKYYLILKIPYRYKKMEVNIESEKIYLPTIEDIKPNTKLKCKISIPNIWNYKKENSQFISGTIMEVKDITIM